jgi:hypothetical protein
MKPCPSLPTGRTIVRFLLIAPLAAACLGASTRATEKYVISAETDQWIQRPLSGRNDTVPGEVSSPYPTLVNLSVEWPVEGDDNLDGTVTVAYRRAGDSDWKQALPLRRVPGGSFHGGSGGVGALAWTNKHAGSILDLEPDTEYEIALRLTDPDGGNAERRLRARTRPEPADMPGARVRKVTPETLRAEAAGARPGDVFLLAPGNYGFFHPERDGEPGKPIVFRADPQDQSEQDRPTKSRGRSEFVLFQGFSLAHRRHVHLEGVLTTDTIDLFYAEDCVVRRCIVNAVWGIISAWTPGLARWTPQVASRLGASKEEWGPNRTVRPKVPAHCRNCVIADNIVTGITPWQPSSVHAWGRNLGEGIQITGPGNVVCHNRVTGFRDCISLMEGPFAFDQRSVDIYNNDVSGGTDDAIEVDYAGANCRVLRNRITNSMRGVALAPALGGPVYVVRNVFFNTEEMWQFGRAGLGYVALHNTSLKSGSALLLNPHAHALVRNNLFVGGGPGPIVEVAHGPTGPMPGWDYDGNGYGAADTAFRGDFAGAKFDSLESLRANTPEKHGVQVRRHDFRTPVQIPASLFPEQSPPDFALAPGSAAVDAGAVLPNINDGFTGRAPDLGALELGVAVPVYGPRSEEGNQPPQY